MTPDWHTSTYSGSNGCVQTRWHKSTRSSDSGNCVEVAHPDGTVQVRDSKQADGPVLTFDLGAWRQFIDAVRAGRL